MKKRFLSCDWGTSSFRLRLIDTVSGHIIAESNSAEGISRTNESFLQFKHPENQRLDFFYAVIVQHIKKLQRMVRDMENNLVVVISGMASAGIGMAELPYTVFPFVVGGNGIIIKRMAVEESRLANELVIVSGACTATDVMRGEETQLIGCINAHAGGKQLFIFPGTHSKHIVTHEQTAIDLTTYMTGEFFELLSKKSILKDSIAAGEPIGNGSNGLAFERGVTDSLQQNLLHSSFMVRTNGLFNKFSKNENYYYLSGLLIGAELSSLPASSAEHITIAGDADLVSNYVYALKVLKINTPVTVVNAATATIQGQLAVFRRLYLNDETV